MIKISEIFELSRVTDDPRFEGFAVRPTNSLLGRNSIRDDLTPGFGVADENRKWQQPQLSSKWKPLAVEGRVAEFNDYPGLDMVLPAFSKRAIDVLRDLLEPNGEILPLSSRTKTKFFFYNVLKIADVLNRSKSVCDFWCRPTTTATNIKYFQFHEKKIQELSIFRIPEFPRSTMVTNLFVDRVAANELKGFEFTKIWPLPKDVNWRMQRKATMKKRERLKKETLVIRFPFEGRAIERRKINRLENIIDEILLNVINSGRYKGVYEGSDEVDNEFRMYLSCPNARKLLDEIREELRAVSWHSEITVCLRKGHLFNENAVETSVSI